MYARVATFESRPENVDDAIAMIRAQVEGEAPPGLEGAKMLMLVNRETGKGVGVTLFESEDAMRRGDEALNGMSNPAVWSVAYPSTSLRFQFNGDVRRSAFPAGGSVNTHPHEETR